MTSSCSFRITRTAEDLAQTINALSQRLVKLEQRLEAFELSSNNQPTEQPIEEIEMLDGVDKLLKECQELLETSSNVDSTEEVWLEDSQEDTIAA